MEAAARLLARLARFERLEQTGAPTAVVLSELRGLLVDADAWALSEGDERARAAVRELRRKAEGMS
jgi:hypothetical protein